MGRIIVFTHLYRTEDYKFTTPYEREALLCLFAEIFRSSLCASRAVLSSVVVRWVLRLAAGSAVSFAVRARRRIQEATGFVCGCSLVSSLPFLPGFIVCQALLFFMMCRRRCSIHCSGEQHRVTSRCCKSKFYPLTSFRLCILLSPFP